MRNEMKLPKDKTCNECEGKMEQLRQEAIHLYNQRESIEYIANRLKITESSVLWLLNDELDVDGDEDKDDKLCKCHWDLNFMPQICPRCGNPTR
jgi:hypothetical protein